MRKDDKKEPENELHTRYKNPSEYEKYIKRNYACMRADSYKVEISQRLYYRATKDKAIEKWLEQNLNMLPDCMKNLNDMVTVTGGRMVSCICHMNNYNNISTEIGAADKVSRQITRSIIRTTSVGEIEEQVKYNSIFWTSEAESAGFKAKA
ncbi:MAG: hypothetical protein K2N73_04950 [Lachnospiraceae bacterium]|nr:hypothetical protein [Lachnospiraceae bacterium]